MMMITLLLTLALGQEGGERPALGDYFRSEVEKIEARPLAGASSAEEWKRDRPGRQRRLLEMLGLWPLPERTPLNVATTGTIERPDFIIEKLRFESRPGLIVTANLYRPRETDSRKPAILYVCGHAKVEKDGVIYGNKAHYQHHAEWYAANGYVCLVLDTLQLGEIPGIHHGTYREGMWWWYSRGYTPAGVEAWNGVRAIDYLISRPDVDPERIGVTGRSGGGATSWWIGAIDDRVAAVAPVAGITDLRNHVVDGVVSGHCDCMFIVNTACWDYDAVAALVAPKPLLLENTDQDPIFPLDGVRRIEERLKTVYGWYGAGDRFGVVIGAGGHVDSEEIRHPSFAFMEKWLKGKAPEAIAEPDRTVPIEELKVLRPGESFPDATNGTIQETFVARTDDPPAPATTEEWSSLKAKMLDRLRAEVFGGWPGDEDAVPLKPRVIYDEVVDGIRVRGFGFDSQEGVPLALWWLAPEAGGVKSVALRVLDQSGWDAYGAKLVGDAEARKQPNWSVLGDARAAIADGASFAFISPRGVPGANLAGASSPIPEKQLVHVKRRFELIGQTLDGMRAYDVRRALAVARGLPGRDEAPIRLEGEGDAASWALWAAVFEPGIVEVRLTDLPLRAEDGPAFLNLDGVASTPFGVGLLADRKLAVEGKGAADALRWVERIRKLAEDR